MTISTHSPKDSFTLTNGVEIPCLGFGTWRLKQGVECYEAVKHAIRVGYRHIDTAAIYENEESVGQAVRNGEIPRRELFITSKLWNTSRTFDQSIRAFDESMAKLNLDYLDLYLIHWPSVLGIDKDWERTNREKWRALEQLYLDGRIRAIGVSNFLPHHLLPLLEQATVSPLVNQLEIHPGYPQTDTVAFCQSHGILPEAWSPLARGSILDVPELKAIADKLSRSPAQVCLRWCLQNGVLPLTKSSSPERMAANADLFEFSIPDEDMRTINLMPPCGGSCINPDDRTF